MNLSDMSVDDLFASCQQETKKFRDNKAHDTRYCFELFRRAFLDSDMTAFNRVYEIYIPQVERWVHRHPSFEVVRGTRDVEDFTSEALMNFHQALLRNNKLNDFDHLAQVLQYMKLCVHTVICEEGRRLPDEPPQPIGTDIEAGEVEVSEERTPEDILTNSDFVQRLWQRLQEIFTDENDRLLCRCVYIYSMKPREIADEYPHIWENARDVSVNKQRIQRNIYNDPLLRQYAIDASTNPEDMNP